MMCPYCRSKSTRVIDKRDYGDACVSRRRRMCADCKKRFTTYERIEELSVIVIKKDGTLQNFDENKIKKGLEIACDKRVPQEVLDKLTEDIKLKILNRKSNKVAASDIGRMVLTRLKNLDKIAYMRFASVFLDFEDLNEFKNELDKLNHSSN